MKNEIARAISLLITEYDLPAFSPDRIEMWMKALVNFPAGSVLRAVENHVRSSRFKPQLADIVAGCQAQVGGAWLSADEAWAQVPKQENKPGLLNDVTAKALSVAYDLLAAGDETAARMAFKGAYQRLVEQAKIAGQQPKYWISPGGTHQEMEAMRDEGVRLGLLPAPVPVPPPLQLAAPSSKPFVKPDLKALLLSLQPKAMPAPDAEDYRVH